MPINMKQLFLATTLFTSPALAQQSAPTPIGTDPAQAALGQEIMECVGAKIQLRTKINLIEAELAKAKAPPVEGPPSAPSPRAN